MSNKIGRNSDNQYNNRKVQGCCRESNIQRVNPECHKATIPKVALACRGILTGWKYIANLSRPHLQRHSSSSQGCMQYVMTGVKMSLIGDWKSNPHGSIDGDLTDLIPTEALTPVNKQENSKKKKKKMKTILLTLL